MQDRDQLHFDRREQIQQSDKSAARQEQAVVTRISNEARGEGYLATRPHPDVYRQALRVILETPQVERRLNYVTAGTIVTILGSWLAGSLMKTRAFTIFIDLVLFFCSVTLAGLLVGVMLGEGVIPLNTVPVLLFVMLALLIFVVAIILGSLVLRAATVKE